MTDEELKKTLLDMAKSQKKAASLWWNFLRGVFYGLGFFIGSAILAAAIIYILSKLEGWDIFGGSIEQIINTANNINS